MQLRPFLKKFTTNGGDGLGNSSKKDVMIDIIISIFSKRKLYFHKAQQYVPTTVYDSEI